MKIAFLFLTIGDLNFPDIWKQYFKGNWNNIEIFCHPKYPEKVKTEWLKKGILPKENLVETKWAFLTNAYIELLIYSIINSKCDKFIFVSDSCLPIKSFNKLYNMFSKDNINTSYISYEFDSTGKHMDRRKTLKEYGMKINNGDYDKNDINKYLKALIEKKYILPTTIELSKHSGWFCLSRYHVKKLLNNPLTYLYDKVSVGDEHILSFLIFSNDKYIKRFKMTEVIWDFKTHAIINIEIKKLYEEKEKIDAKVYPDKIMEYDKIIKEKRYQRAESIYHPLQYNEIDDNLLNILKKTKSFFFRKIVKSDKPTNVKKVILKLII